MLKKIALLGVCFSFLGTVSAQATPYDDCLKSLAEQKKNVLSEYEYSICMKQESARLLSEIQKIYTQIANDKDFAKWNKGNGMYKGRVRDTYNAWLVYRNNYCDLMAEAVSKDPIASVDFHRENCKMTLSEQQLESAKGIMIAKETPDYN